MQVTERLSESESELKRLEQLLELGEERIASLKQLEQGQRKRKTFVDRHRRETEKSFEIGTPVLVFQTRLGTMLGKLRFRWTGPFWIVDDFNGTFQLGSLAEEVLRN